MFGKRETAVFTIATLLLVASIVGSLEIADVRKAQGVQQIVVLEPFEDESPESEPAADAATTLEPAAHESPPPSVAPTTPTPMAPTPVPSNATSTPPTNGTATAPQPTHATTPAPDPAQTTTPAPANATKPTPPKDTDGDRIADTVDKCPTKREVRNGYLDKDGCPDTVTTTRAS